VKNFFYAALGSENHSFSPESGSQTRAARLKQDGNYEQSGGDNLSDIYDKLEVHIINSIADYAYFVNPVRPTLKIFSFFPAAFLSAAEIKVVLLGQSRALHFYYFCQFFDAGAGNLVRPALPPFFFAFFGLCFHIPIIIPNIIPIMI